MALEFGAGVLRLLVKMPSGSGTIDDNLIQNIIIEKPTYIL